VIDLTTWIVSDTHFGHKNIVKYCNRPMNHNELMVKNWQAVVKPGDTVLHLGDVAVWYGPEQEHWLEVAKSLPGNKLMLLGNHDKLKPKVWAEYGFTVIPEFVQEFNGKRVLFTHAPAGHRRARHTDQWVWDINVHGHIHNNDHRDGDDELYKGRIYKNVSVEVMAYTPTPLSAILST
jgi:calcineurin-like phosphoesterase family protein